MPASSPVNDAVSPMTLDPVPLNPISLMCCQRRRANRARLRLLAQIPTRPLAEGFPTQKNVGVAALSQPIKQTQVPLEPRLYLFEFFVHRRFEFLGLRDLELPGIEQVARIPAQTQLRETLLRDGLKGQ
jgi:hypothetical protein